MYIPSLAQTLVETKFQTLISIRTSLTPRSNHCTIQEDLSIFKHVTTLCIKKVSERNSWDAELSVNLWKAEVFKANYNQ